MDVDSAYIMDDTGSKAALYKALGNPVRLHMVQLLADQAAYGIPNDECCAEGEVCVCRMTSSFALSMPTISHHLKVLREAGLVRGRRDGVWIYYSLNPERLHEAAALLGFLANKAEASSAAGSRRACPCGSGTVGDSTGGSSTVVGNLVLSAANAEEDRIE